MASALEESQAPAKAGSEMARDVCRNERDLGAQRTSKDYAVRADALQISLASAILVNIQYVLLCSSLFDPMGPTSTATQGD